MLNPNTTLNPNSHGAYGIYTNVAHFGGLGGAFGPYSLHMFYTGARIRTYS